MTNQIIKKKKTDNAEAVSSSKTNLRLKLYSIQAAAAEQFKFIFGLLAITALILVFIMGIKSKLFKHPDEFESYKAIVYFMTHWQIPSIKNPMVYFSIYGTTRMSELNLYYFFAGKLAEIITNFHFFQTVYRMFSMLLFAVLVFYSIKRYHASKSLMFLLLITPQLWYLFSYATSDSFDFFLSFVILYQLVCEKSMLNRLLTEPLTKKSILYGLCISALFALQLMSKANYYVTIVMLFFVLLIRLAFCEKAVRKEFFIKCLALLCCSLVFFSIRVVMDESNYGFEKNAAVCQMEEEKAGFRFKPSRPLKEKYITMQLHDKGVKLDELLFKKQFFRKSFRSLTGGYGYLQYFNQDWYYNVMMGLYIALLVMIIFYCVKTKEREKILALAAMLLLVFLSIALSVYNSWFVDFQPQGRYLLPALIPIAYCASLNKKIFKNLGFNLLLLATCSLSVYSFISSGILKLCYL